jgi:uncharacterized membrane protein YbhN (UPF0104 family)
MKLRRILSTLLGILIAGLTLHFAFKGYSSTDAIILIRDSSKSALLLFLICSLSMAALRAIRFSVLLGLTGSTASWGKVLAITFIRNLCADLLPAKAGSAVVIPLATERLNVPLPKAIAAWSAEYVLDIIVLIPLVLVLSPALASALGVSSVSLVLAMSAVLLVLVILFAFWKKYLAQMIMSYIGGLPKLREGLEYLQAYGTPKLFSLVISLSLVIRALKYLGLYFLATALLAPLGFSRADLPIGPVTLAAFASEAASSIPGLSIGGLGAPQGVWGMLISQLGAPLTLAVLVGVASYIFTQGYALVLGALGLLYLYVPVSIGSPKRSLISVPQKAADS